MERFEDRLPTHNQPPHNHKTQRQFLKCEQCRQNRKKCEYIDGSSKCIRCTRLGHGCGEPTRKKRERKADENSGRLTENGSSSQPVAVGTTPVLHRAMLDRGGHHGQMSDGIAVNAMLSKLFGRARSDLDYSITFEKASNPLLATSSHWKSQALHEFMNLLIKYLNDCLVSGTTSPEPSRRTVESLSTDLNAQSVDSVPSEVVLLACSANVPKPWKSTSAQIRGHVSNAVRELPKSYYLHTESVVKQHMTSIIQNAPEEWSAHLECYNSVARNHGPFPAWAIAYLNLDFKVAYQLWKDTAEEGFVVDILGRSFVHLVAESGDSEPFGRIGDSWRRYAGLDGRDLSLLDLGIIGNSAWIVIKVIEGGFVQPPYTRAIQRAILGNRPEIAIKHLLPYLKSTHWTDTSEISVLADLAGEQHEGFRPLQAQLSGMVSVQPTRDLATADLDKYDFSNFEPVPFTLDSRFGLRDVWNWPPLELPVVPDAFRLENTASLPGSHVNHGSAPYGYRYDQPFPPS